MAGSIDEKLQSPDSTINVPAFSLENILGENHDAVEHPGTNTNDLSDTAWNGETPENQVTEGYCVECEGGQDSDFLCGIRRL